MRYNPCGRIVDIGRSPYKAACRFFRDNGVVDEVRWYECREGTPTLDKVSVIYRREWDNDQYNDVPVGELPGERKRFLKGEVPKGLPGVHVCGTDRDFEEGGEYDPDQPEVQYGTLGWPLCCDPPVGVRGPAGAGGRVHPEMIPPPPPCELPNGSCSAAPFGQLGPLCDWPEAFYTNAWRAWQPGVGVHLEFRFEVHNPAALQFVALYEGPDCGTLTPLTAAYVDTTTSPLVFSFTSTQPRVYVNLQMGYVPATGPLSKSRLRAV